MYNVAKRRRQILRNECSHYDVITSKFFNRHLVKLVDVHLLDGYLFELFQIISNWFMCQKGLCESPLSFMCFLFLCVYQYWRRYIRPRRVCVKVNQYSVIFIICVLPTQSTLQLNSFPTLSRAISLGLFIVFLRFTWLISRGYEPKFLRFLWLSFDALCATIFDIVWARR